MPAGCPAFGIGERIRFGSISQLEGIQAQMRKQREKIEAGELPFGICEIVVRELAAHSGEVVSIKAIGSYHFDVPIYEFHEVLGRWPEEALCDPHLDQASINVIFEPARLHYSIHSELHGHHDGVVRIRGIKDGKTYCSLRKSNAEWIASGIRRITEIRSRHAFETLFMFDGDYELPSKQ